MLVYVLLKHRPWCSHVCKVPWSGVWYHEARDPDGGIVLPAPPLPPGLFSSIIQSGVVEIRVRIKKATGSASS